MFNIKNDLFTAEEISKITQKYNITIYGLLHGKQSMATYEFWNLIHEKNVSLEEISKNFKCKPRTVDRGIKKFRLHNGLPDSIHHDEFYKCRRYTDVEFVGI